MAVSAAATKVRHRIGDTIAHLIIETTAGRDQLIEHASQNRAGSIVLVERYRCQRVDLRQQCLHLLGVEIKGLHAHRRFDAHRARGIKQHNVAGADASFAAVLHHNGVALLQIGQDEVSGIVPPSPTAIVGRHVRREAVSRKPQPSAHVVGNGGGERRGTGWLGAKIDLGQISDDLPPNA
jgi:hypothetical protein